MTIKKWYTTTSPCGCEAGKKTESAFTDGADTPAFLRKNGIFTENVYTARYDDVSNPGVKAWSWVDGRTRCVDLASNGCFPSIANPPTPSLTSVLPKLVEKWTSSQFNVGVTVGEGRESLEMIANRISSIGSSIKALKKRNLGDAVKHLGQTSRKQRMRAKQKLDADDLSGSWLELQYGWMPFINDVYNLTSMVRLDPRVGIIRASAKNEGAITWSSPYVAAGGRRIKNERRVHVKVVVSQAPSQLERMGLTDPAYTVWELTRLSFVVDWFLPIGDYLKSLHAITALPVSNYVITNVRQHECSVDVSAGQQISKYLQSLDSAQYHSWYTELGRACFTQLDPILLGVLDHAPTLVKPVWDPSVSKVMNGVALLHANRKGLL